LIFCIVFFSCNKPLYFLKKKKKRAGALWRVLGGFIATDVVRRQVSPFSSSGRCAADPQIRRDARSNSGCLPRREPIYKRLGVLGETFCALSSSRHCAADFEKRVCASFGAVARTAARRTPWTRQVYVCTTHAPTHIANRFIAGAAVR
jgi:hypothetical protein